jgi:hypothetical protein
MIYMDARVPRQWSPASLPRSWPTCVRPVTSVRPWIHPEAHVADLLWRHLHLWPWEPKSLCWGWAHRPWSTWRCRRCSRPPPLLFSLLIKRRGHLVEVEIETWWPGGPCRRSHYIPVRRNSSSWNTNPEGRRHWHAIRPWASAPLLPRDLSAATIICTPPCPWRRRSQ